MVSTVFGKLQIVSAGFMGLGHGGNDAQKTMGIIALALVAGTKAGDLAQTYPLARGTAPLLTTTGGIFLVERREHAEGTAVRIEDILLLVTFRSVKLPQLQELADVHGGVTHLEREGDVDVEHHVAGNGVRCRHASS